MIYETLFCRSPLATAASPSAADMIDSIFRDGSVQRTAGPCAAKRPRRAEIASFRSEISEAIEAIEAIEAATARSGNGEITPTMIVEVLRQRAEEIDNAAEDCKEDRARHDAASSARMAHHEPLREAGNKHVDRLTVERAGLFQADDAERRLRSMRLTGESRYAVLRASSLTDAQIEAIEPSALNPDVTVARRRSRIARITPLIDRLKALGTSINFDAAAIAGFDPPVDSMIVARNEEMVVA